MQVMVQYRDEFFKECKEVVEKNHVYKNHVNKFIDYLCLPEVNLASTPQRINIETVKECIEYYHTKGDINTRATMESHLESVKSFYDYLSTGDKLSDIFSNFDYAQFKDQIVKEVGLMESKERGYYKCNDIKKLLLLLDDEIEKYDEGNDLGRKNDRYIQQIIIRLFVKITLIAPAKRKTIIGIKQKDFMDHYKKLNINDVEINIPCGLTRDIKMAIKYAEKKNGIPIKEEDNLFEYIYQYKGKFEGTKLNTWFGNIVNEFGIFDEGKKSYGVEAIRNMAVQMMINNMINPVFISQITGITMSTIETTYYSKGWKYSYIEDQNTSINKAIAQNEYYCYI